MGRWRNLPVTPTMSMVDRRDVINDAIAAITGGGAFPHQTVTVQIIVARALRNLGRGRAIAGR